MQPDKSHPVRRNASQTDADALTKRILLSLPYVDREALVRFYFEHQTAERIEQSLGLPAGYVAGLKLSVKARFFEERWPEGTGN
jgi:hypothetical protein